MSITKYVVQSFFEEEDFTLKDAERAVLEDAKMNVKTPSIRGRIYEAINKGILQRISRGVYTVNNALLIQGDGRDLSFLRTESIDAIVTDHPYDLKKSNKGGNRNFADYDAFQYNQEDFDEKYRVLKEGAYLCEFIPEESAENYEYLHKIKVMAKKAGFKYYAKVPWEKKGFVANCGRKSKNTEEVLMFTKGKSRKLRADAKKTKREGKPCFMSGTNGMLPTRFEFSKTPKMIHQAEKPVDLLETIIDYITQEGEILLDQFAGSGSMGEAAINKKRKAILIEIDDENVVKIQSRLNMKLTS
jgi:site-specific DNA-methyltransferase (adenine-specific)